MTRGQPMMQHTKIAFFLLLALLWGRAWPEMEIHYIHTDHLGTPQMLTDENQNVVWKVERQTPFGEVVVNEDPDGDGKRVEFNLRFAGQYYDKETGLNYNGARYYDPRTGGYTQSDPIGLDDGPNTYAYVGNNPINYIDPDGLSRRRPGAPSPLQIITNVQATTLINQIRRIDPTFRFPVASPGGPGQPVNYSPTTVRQLQQILNNAQNANVCGPAATTPVGRSGNHPMNVLPSSLTSPTTINVVPFSQHALQQMRGRGIPPTPVLNAIQNGTRSPGNQPGTTMHVAPGVTVITNSTTGNVITVIPNRI